MCKTFLALPSQAQWWIRAETDGNSTSPSGQRSALSSAARKRQNKVSAATDAYLISGISPSWHLRDRPLWFWIGLNPGIQYIKISSHAGQNAAWLKGKIIRFDHWLGAEIVEPPSPFAICTMNKTRTDRQRNCGGKAVCLFHFGSLDFDVCGGYDHI